MNDNSPIVPSNRLPIIDILRGWALLSVVVMNYLAIYNWNNHSINAKLDNLTEYIEATCEFFLGSKGWTLLAVLFGFGFSALLANISKSGKSEYTFFAKRMLWLFVLAFFNTLFFGGDILNDYALLGLVSLLFYNFKTKTLVVTGLLILLLTPLLQSYLGSIHMLFAPNDRDAFYKLYNQNTILNNIKANLFMRYKWMFRLSYSLVLHLIQLGCFLLGVALHRSNFLFQINNDTKLLKRVLTMSLIPSVGISFLQLLIEKYDWKFNEYYDLFYPQILCIMIFTTSCIVWIYLSGKAKRVFNALQTIGKMTLTSYILQNVISFILFICLRPNWAMSWYLLTGFAVYLFQILFAKWYFTKFNYGLVEWLWRSLSCGRIVHLRK